MPESCHYLTALHAHSHPCLVSLLFIPSLYSTFLIRRIFYLLVSFLFFTAQLCSGRGKRTWHKHVIDINNIYNFCCLRLFVVVYKHVISVLIKPCHSMSVCQVL